MTDPATPAAPDEDELTRQRRKHWNESLQRQVPRFGVTTLGDILADLLEAAADGDDSFCVTRFLTERGHSPQTICALRSYLGLERDTAVSGDDPARTVVRWPPGNARMRMLDRIRSMLLED